MPPGAGQCPTPRVHLVAAPCKKCCSLTKKLNLETRIENCQDSRKSLWYASGGSTDSRKKVSHGGWHC